MVSFPYLFTVSSSIYVDAMEVDAPDDDDASHELEEEEDAVFPEENDESSEDEELLKSETFLFQTEKFNNYRRLLRRRLTERSDSVGLGRLCTQLPFCGSLRRFSGYPSFADLFRGDCSLQKADYARYGGTRTTHLLWMQFRTRIFHREMSKPPRGLSVSFRELDQWSDACIPESPASCPFLPSHSNLSTVK